ncbi:MAG: hypothetical protein ACTSRF_07885 [Candidatus Freyarchaeota archaeon]
MSWKDFNSGLKADLTVEGALQIIWNTNVLRLVSVTDDSEGATLLFLQTFADSTNTRKLTPNLK